MQSGFKSPALSAAHAIFVFVENVLRAMDGERNIVMPAFVDSDIFRDCRFFACSCVFGAEGVERVVGVGDTSHSEAQILEESVLPLLRSEIREGTTWIKNQYKGAELARKAKL